MTLTRLAIRPARETCFYNDGNPVAYVLMEGQVVKRICQAHAEQYGAEHQPMTWPDEPGYYPRERG